MTDLQWAERQAMTRAECDREWEVTKACLAMSIVFSFIAGMSYGW